MKINLLLWGAVFLVAGCGDNSSKPAGGTNAASSSPQNAAVDYVNALSKGKQDAVKVADASRLDQAVQQFSGEHGRYPKDLNELVTEKYINKVPDPPYGMTIVYDANAGTVKVVPK